MTAESVFKAMADPTRRRILQALLQNELTVSELIAALELPQSTVSRHLRVLRETDLISDRRNGTTVHYAPSVAALEAEGGALQSRVVSWLREESVPPALRRRLEQVLELRHAETLSFFESVGRRWDRMRTDCFGGRFPFEALTALLPSSWVVADIGTGTGYLLPVLADTFRRVIAVEPVAALLEVARARPELRSLDHVEFRSGDLGALPLANGEVDLAVAMLVLQHVPDPAAAWIELGRVVRSGGRVLLVDLKPHHSTAFRELMGGRWWGFDPQQWLTPMERAGWTRVRWRDVRTAEPVSPAVPETPGLFALTAERSG